MNPFEIAEEDVPRGSLSDFTVVFREKILVDEHGSKKLYG